MAKEIKITLDLPERLERLLRERSNQYAEQFRQQLHQEYKQSFQRFRTPTAEEYESPFTTYRLFRQRSGRIVRTAQRTSIFPSTSELGVTPEEFNAARIPWSSYTQHAQQFRAAVATTREDYAERLLQYTSRFSELQHRIHQYKQGHGPLATLARHERTIDKVQELIRDRRFSPAPSSYPIESFAREVEARRIEAETAWRRKRFGLMGEPYAVRASRGYVEALDIGTPAARAEAARKAILGGEPVQLSDLINTPSPSLVGRIRQVFRRPMISSHDDPFGSLSYQKGPSPVEQYLRQLGRSIGQGLVEGAKTARRYGATGAAYAARAAGAVGEFVREFGTERYWYRGYEMSFGARQRLERLQRQRQKRLEVVENIEDEHEREMARRRVESDYSFDVHQLIERDREQFAAKKRARFGGRLKTGVIATTAALTRLASPSVNTITDIVGGGIGGGGYMLMSSAAGPAGMAAGATLMLLGGGLIAAGKAGVWSYQQAKRGLGLARQEELAMLDIYGRGGKELRDASDSQKNLRNIIGLTGLAPQAAVNLLDTYSANLLATDSYAIPANLSNVMQTLGTTRLNPALFARWQSLGLLNRKEGTIGNPEGIAALGRRTGATAAQTNAAFGTMISSFMPLVNQGFEADTLFTQFALSGMIHKVPAFQNVGPSGLMLGANVIANLNKTRGSLFKQMTQTGRNLVEVATFIKAMDMAKGNYFGAVENLRHMNVHTQLSAVGELLGTDNELADYAATSIGAPEGAGDIFAGHLWSTPSGKTTTRLRSSTIAKQAKINTVELDMAFRNATKSVTELADILDDAAKAATELSEAARTAAGSLHEAFDWF